MSQVHARARTTPLMRAEIRASKLGLVELAERYNISRATAAKWKGRDEVQDRPHKLNTTLSEGQEAIVAEVRRLTLIPLDDLLAVVPFARRQPGGLFVAPGSGAGQRPRRRAAAAFGELA